MRDDVSLGTDFPRVGYLCSRPSSDDEPILKKRSACSSGRCVCGWTPVSVVSPQHASQTDLRQLLTYLLRLCPFCFCIAVNSRCSARFVASAPHLPSISRTDYCTVCWDKRWDRLDSARWATRRRRWSDARRRRVRCAAHTPPTTVVRRRTRLLRRRLHPASLCRSSRWFSHWRCGSTRCACQQTSGQWWEPAARCR